MNNQTSILDDADLDLVVGGDMTANVGNRVTTRTVEPSKETGPGMIAFVIGFVLGCI
jgi:hypothetical protein